MSAVATVGHLVRRFLGSWSRRPVPPDDLAWVRSMLSEGEWTLWQRAPLADRRHTVAVARRAVDRLGRPPEPAFVAGALLHDIGKLEAGLGTFGRVGATVFGQLRPAAARRNHGRIGRYLRHEELGAALCRRAGSDPATVALVARTSDSPADWLAALGAADDSI